MKKFLSVNLAILLLFVSCSTPDSPPLYSDDHLFLSRLDRLEIEAGERVHNEILSQFYPFDDNAVQLYAESVKNRLIPFVRRKNLPYSVTVLQDDRVYATSAPGGRVYVTTGMLYFLNNEAELASIIAHELAQAQYGFPDPKIKHVAEQAVVLVSMVGSIFLGPFGPLAAMGARALTDRSFYEETKAERSSSADRQALSYLFDAGYDPHASVDIVVRLMKIEQKDIGKVYNYNLSHPITQSRLASLLRNYERLPFDETDREFYKSEEMYMKTMKPVYSLYEEPTTTP